MNIKYDMKNKALQMIFQKFKLSNIFLRLIVIFTYMTCFLHESLAISSRIHIKVNEDAITDSDVSRRINLLNMNKVPGDLDKIAENQLITEMLKKQEMAKFNFFLNPNILDILIEENAINNHLSKKELLDILESNDIGEKHFKQSFGINILWLEFMRKKFQYENTTDTMELPSIKGKEKKATIREYLLRNVIFIIPANKRNNENFIKQRINQAELSRSKFPTDCNKAEEFVAKIDDVYIGKIGRFLETDISPKLNDLLKKTKHTTDSYLTENGVEYTAICDKRDITGEIALREKFKDQDMLKKIEKYSEEYLKKMRSKARIKFYK